MPGYARSIAIVGDLAYVGATGGELLVMDFSNHAQPRMIGKLGGLGLFGAVDIQVAGNFAYVATLGAGLQVIDISNPTQPRHVGALAIPTPNSVAVAGNYAYVAAYKDGLEVVDISVPTNPKHVGQWNPKIELSLEAITAIYGDGVIVSGSLVCLRDSFAGLQWIDVSNPTQLRRARGIFV